VESKSEEEIRSSPGTPHRERCPINGLRVSEADFSGLAAETWVFASPAQRFKKVRKLLQVHRSVPYFFQKLGILQELVGFGEDETF
jgi:hypothetical protein